MKAFGRMDSSIRKRWVAALRGGLYKQGRGQLRSKSDRCCCLGVLCDQVDPREWERVKACGSNNWTYRGGVSVINCHFARELGLNVDEVSLLVELNDNYRLTFDEIAGVIERGNLLV
jgi:hypothetical protein